MADVALPPSVVRDMEEASAFYRRTERLNAPRTRRDLEPVADHAAHELKAAAHEAWYVSQDAVDQGPRPAVDRAAAEIAARGRPAVDVDALLAEMTSNALRSRPVSMAKGPAVPQAAAPVAMRPGRER